MQVTNFLDFSAFNVCNVLGGRSTTTSYNIRWIYSKVFNSKFNLFKLVFYLFHSCIFHDLSIMKVQQATR